MDQPGKIIFLNGASSSGKSTLAAALQSSLPEPFWHYSIDHLNAAKILPQARIRSGEFAWSELREKFFDGFHRSLPAFASAGNNLIVEHIIETEAWMQRLHRLLNGLDVFYVGVHCPLAELERRESGRGDRPIGDARKDMETCHQHVAYDFEVDATMPLEVNVQAVISAWESRIR
jgi:chloramphenicol 3-O phosphotransferase